jgi:hypothetical protein
MTEQKKNLIKTWCVLVFVFGLGVVTGSLNGFRVARTVAEDSSYSGAQPEAQAVPSMRTGDAYFETLQRELELDARQASLMRVVIDETRSQYKAVCAQVRPRYDALRENARARMRVLLTEEQQKRFETIVTREDCQCPEQRSR